MGISLLAYVAGACLLNQYARKAASYECVKVGEQCLVVSTPVCVCDWARKDQCNKCVTNNLRSVGKYVRYGRRRRKNYIVPANARLIR